MCVECRIFNCVHVGIQSNHWKIKDNSPSANVDNLTKYSVEMAKARLSLCIIIQSNVETYYGVEVYLHAFFKTVSVGDVSLTCKHDRYFPT